MGLAKACLLSRKQPQRVMRLLLVWVWEEGRGYRERGCLAWATIWAAKALTLAFLVVIILREGKGTVVIMGRRERVRESLSTRATGMGRKMRRTWGWKWGG
jgi:hypothetical protein